MCYYIPSLSHTLDRTVKNHIFFYSFFDPIICASLTTSYVAAVSSESVSVYIMVLMAFFLSVYTDTA